MMTSICIGVIFLKNAIIKLLVFLLKPKKANSSKEGRSFLIVSTTGLGDTLWATPAIASLRAAHPTSKIYVLTSTIGKEVLSHNPHIDEVILLKKSLFLLFQLKKKKITDVLIFHASQRMILPFVAILGVERIVGTSGINKGLDSLFTEILDNRHVHEIKRRLEIAGVAHSKATLELFLNSQDELEAEAFLVKHLKSASFPLIVIHPGSKDRFKQWPPSHFIALGKLLVQELQAQVLVTGSASEKRLIEEIALQIPGAIRVTDLRVRPFAALLKKVTCMITNDTGPMHIAFAMKTPTIALFSPTDPKLCGPYFAENAVSIFKERTCTPCLRKKCREPFCLLQIGVREVYEACEGLAKLRPRPSCEKK